ncbi:MAG: ATP-binding protein [Hyphomonadaceae bacterium]
MFSRIGRIIFLANFLGLFILVLGVLLLSEWSAGLTQAQFRSLRIEGELLSNILVLTSTTEGDPAPTLNDQAAREVLRGLLPPPADADGRWVGPRVRVFLPNGAVAADTDVLYNNFEHGALPPLASEQSIDQSLRAVGEAARSAEYWRLTPWRPTVSLEQERQRALQGLVSYGQRLDERGQRVVSVTLPIQRVHAVIGLVTLETADVERILLAERLSMIPFVIGAALVTFLSSALLGLFVARPLRLLANAADRLRQSGATRLSLPEVSKRKDEIGEVSRSIEAMTAALADRIDANERFAGDVSHELKNPLASIGSAVEAARTIPDPARQGDMLRIVAQDVRRLDRLITDIARASRIEAESARGELDKVDLGRLVSLIAESYAKAPGETAEVAVAFRGPAPTDAIVLGQETLLGQVFRNLIDNAKSFTPAGGVVTVQVETVRTREGAIVRAKIEDQGPGIPPENLETIFERFYTDRPKGSAFGANSGLGLSIARQIVTAHKGRIWAENIEGVAPGAPVGARLIVELPQAAR